MYPTQITQLKHARGANSKSAALSILRSKVEGPLSDGEGEQCPRLSEQKYAGLHAPGNIHVLQACAACLPVYLSVCVCVCVCVCLCVCVCVCARVSKPVLPVCLRT